MKSSALLSNAATGHTIMILSATDILREEVVSMPTQERRYTQHQQRVTIYVDKIGIVQEDSLAHLAECMKQTVHLTVMQGTLEDFKVYPDTNTVYIVLSSGE